MIQLIYTCSKAKLTNCENLVSDAELKMYINQFAMFAKIYLLIE